ncbi:hypothetical protein FRC11_005940, partial [Ceratobasidium sp. 423]
MNRLHKASPTLKDSPDNCVTVYTELAYRYQICNTGDYTLQKFRDDITGQLQPGEAKLKEIQVTIDNARNSTLPVSRADSLPDDILMQIFRFVLDTCPAPSESHHDWVRDNVEATPLIEPSSDYLTITQSCSVWRRVALGSKSLWTDIEISPFSPFLTQFLSRAEAYAKWSGDVPIYLRIHEDCEPSSALKIPSRLMNVITLHHLNILDLCLTHCKPGVLTHLEIKTSRLRPGPKGLPFDRPKHGFFHGADPVWDDIGNQTDTLLTMPDNRLEDVLRPVTSLRLNRLYPVWPSFAYRGLIELALLSRNNGEGPDPIPEASLALMFQSNPRLRILHFGIKISSESTSLPTILDDLEILHLEAPCIETQQSILRLISPGKKLFRVKIKLLSRDIPLQVEEQQISFKGVQEELRRCIARSQVTEFFLETDIEKNLHAILKMIPHVRVLG